MPGMVFLDCQEPEDLAGKMEASAGSAHAEEGDGELRERQPSRELEDLENQQRQRRRRNDMLARLQLCPSPRRQHAFEQRAAGAARLASACLRSRVTIPAHVEGQGDWQDTIDAAARFPRVHCAFRTCPWPLLVDDEAARRKAVDEAEAHGDDALEPHIKETHKQEIQEVALVEEEYVWDVYGEALAAREGS